MFWQGIGELFPSWDGRLGFVLHSKDAKNDKAGCEAVSPELKIYIRLTVSVHRQHRTRLDTTDFVLIVIERSMKRRGLFFEVREVRTTSEETEYRTV